MSDFARRPLLGGLAVATALAALSPGRAGAQGNAQAGELRLGALYPFSGSLALLGDEGFRGLETAAEERNAAGGLLGRPIRLVKGDATEPEQAAAEARRLMGAERVAAIFGTYDSALASAATRVTELQGLPYFELGAISDRITERGFRYLFRTCPRASDFGRETVNAIPDVLAPLWNLPPAGLRLAILHEDALVGQSVANSQEAQIKARGLLQLDRLAYPARSVDLSAAVQRLRSIAAEVVLHTGQPGDIALFYRGMREAGWRPRMVIGSGGGYSLVDTARTIGPAFEGTMDVDFTQFEVNERIAPGVRQFVEIYRRTYGSEPRSGHSLANYAGARLCFDAVQRAGGTDKDRIRAAMLASDVAEGTTPTGWGARFDETGQNQRARPFLMQWQESRLVTVAPAEAAVAPPRPGFGKPG
jgi:branched-chain amino acid transport system substrate-binding protein